ncbi:MAG: nodulation protein [Saprospiraceae bacterium]|nr:nodulation protein [Saprospiraceae bacterium]
MKQTVKALNLEPCCAPKDKFSKHMNILGINGGFRQGYQDVSAVLVCQGEVIAAIEEERLSRVKFSAGKLPYLAIQEVLRIGNLAIQDIQVVAFHGSTWEPAIEERLAEYFIHHFGYAPPVQRFHHHHCHAASAYYASGFEEALVVTIDNSGDGISTQIAVGQQKLLHVLKQFDRSQSIGFYYSLINQYCGFVKDSDEYKLMGLSSYGQRHSMDLDWLLNFEQGELKLCADYIRTVPAKAPPLHRDDMNFSPAFKTRMGAPRRLPGTAITDFYKDVAASAQQHLEDVVLKMLLHYAAVTGQRKLCMAGGVALNCVMNQRILESGAFAEVFIQPASSDAGISLGAAWLAAAQAGDTPVITTHTYHGNDYPDASIQQVLDSCQIPYSIPADIVATAASLIAQNKVVGWFQGRMEYGPRALGNRSILANATQAGMNDRVNHKIKLRESFRPFCPSVLQEDAALYFDAPLLPLPYMTVTVKVRPAMQALIPAVTHVDGTARIQTVNATQNPLYYKLLNQIKLQTGHGVVLNTSFNLGHEPIVCTPRDAWPHFTVPA